jgi:hypothetical protein
MPTSQRSNAQVFRQQQIDLEHPGTILRDFETLLDSFGTEGLPAPGKHYLLPQDVLVELDARMAKPLRLRMKRPQQRSYPHLNGLYLLLRATQLAVPKGTGKTSGRLVLDPAVLDAWRSLNSTEQYFNLLEAWLLRGRESMLGEREGGSLSGEMARHTIDVWNRIGEKGVQVRKERFDVFYGVTARCMLALLELFGLADVNHGEPAEGESWQILAARRTPFGEAIFDTVLTLQQVLSWTLDSRDDQPDFGIWQPILQEHFPDWRGNLRLPEPEFRDGVYYFKVKLGSPWRRIAISAYNTLDNLAWAIIEAYRFDGDHLYKFDFRQRDGSHAEVTHSYVEDAKLHTNDYSIGDLPLEEGQSMEFLYDFGTSWRFDVKLEKVEPPNPRITKPRVVESHGKAPKEYVYDDDDEDDDDE